MNMKNTKRMRTFFLGALVLSISAWIGGRQYYLKLNEKEQEKIIEVQEAETEQFEESVESANIQNKKAFVVREEDGYLNVYSAKRMPYTCILELLIRDCRKN